MTTIILVALGILLAASAAVMTVFYGGASLTHASVGARADVLQNAGQNVDAAAGVYAATQGTIPASYADLVASGIYMKRAAIPSDDGTPSEDWRTFGSGSSTETAFVVTGVDADVCARIQRNLSGRETIPDTPDARFGCAKDGASYLYYAMLNGTPAAAPAFSFDWTLGYREPADSTLPYANDGTLVAAPSAPDGKATAFASLARGQDAKSPNGSFDLRMQYDGNLVEYRNGQAVWKTDTYGDQYHVVMQPDGNLVVYDKDGNAPWASGSRGSNLRLVLQDDGNLVIYDGVHAVWANNVTYPL